MKTFLRLTLAALLASGLALGQEIASKKTMLDSLVEEALLNNPQIEAAAQKVEAAEMAVKQAGLLPDPQLALGLMNMPVNSFSFSQEPMTGKRIALMQMFPFPGKRSLAKDMAESATASIREMEEEVRNALVHMVKKTYFDIFAIDRSLETVEKNTILMKQFVQAVEAKYETGSGLQQDVLRSQVELTKLDDDLIMWTQKRAAAVARLNGLLNRPQDAVLETTPRDLEFPLDPDPYIPREDITESRPLLRAWEEKLRKAETAVKLARKDFWPNFSISAAYSQRNNLAGGAVMHDFVSTSVSLSIPIFLKRKQGAKWEEKSRELAALQAEYNNMLSVIRSEIKSLQADLERDRKRAELYKGGILLQAQQALESAFAGYQVGKVDFLTLISGWTMLQNYELQYVFALAGYHKTLAALEFAEGQADSPGETEEQEKK